MSRRSRPLSLERIAVATLLAVVAAAGTAGAVARPSQQAVEVDELADDLVAGGTYQTEFPGSGADVLRIPIAGEFAELLAWVLTIAIVLLMLVWLVRELIGRQSVFSDDDAPLADGAARAAGGPSLEQAERLAAQGRFDEAVHAMLLISIRHLGRGLPARPGVSTTSRELLRLLPLTRRGSEAFRELVREVERSLFGGQPVGAADYERCRSSLGTLLAETAS